MSGRERTFEMEIDLDATPDEVWRALTEADELVHWFPFDARVTPGPGGTMQWSWGDSWDWTTRIEAWEPGRRLLLVQDDQRPYDAEGRPLPEGTVQPARIALEFRLETHQGRTRLRLVHSGFGTGAAWDDEVDGISTGWPAELRSLRLYLRRHFGRSRHVAWARVTTDLTVEEAWRRLTPPGGFRPNAPAMDEGQPYSVDSPTGDRFQGRVDMSLPGRAFQGTVTELDDALFRLSVERSAGKTGVSVWLASYRPGDGARVAAFRAAAQAELDRMFAR
jgi:uncharacterized protein YndB with AHSA1/START domain